MTLSLFPEREASGPRVVTLVRLAAEVARSAAAIGRLAVEGEVHRPTTSGAGRVYFTLRDRAAQVTVVCPRARVSRCRTVAGERVCVVGVLNWVNERGELQLVAEEVTPVGDGAVAAMVAEARRHLADDGLLERPRRALPLLPDLIGVVCGTDAAVKKDIEAVVAVRYPGYPVRFEETTVSGPGAAGSIQAALEALAADAAIGVIVLARGGGDATQMLPFSDEELCRAIARCRVPVVSAIGHDGDRPLCDEVADLRCATPSLAGAAVVPERRALLAALDAGGQRRAAAATRMVEAAARRLAGVEIARAARGRLSAADGRLGRGGDKLALLHPRRQAAESVRRLAGLDGRSPVRRRLERAMADLSALDGRRPMRQRVSTAAERLDADGRHLGALSPLRVLERGYAVVRLGDGTVVRQASQVGAGQGVHVQLARGALVARVEEVADD